MNHERQTNPIHVVSFTEKEARDIEIFLRSLFLSPFTTIQDFYDLLVNRNREGE